MDWTSVKFKGQLLLLFVMGNAAFSFSQTARLVVFEPNLKPFYIYLNGELQDTVPKANYTIDSLAQISYQVAIKFDLDSAIVCNKELVFYQQRETVFYLHKRKNGKYTIKYKGETYISPHKYENFDGPVAIPKATQENTVSKKEKGRVVN